MNQEENRYNIAGLNRRIKYIGITRFIRAMGRSSTFIFLPLILIQFYGLSFIEAGLLQGFATLLMAIVQLYAGHLTDRIGRRVLMVLIPIPNVFFFLLMFFAIHLHYGVSVLVGSWFATVLVNALQYPALQAAVADLSPDRDRMSAFTLVRIMVNLGVAVGPIMGGFLASVGFEYIFLVASIASIIEVVVLYFAVPETYESRESGASVDFGAGLRRALKSRFFLYFILVGIIFQFFIRQSSISLTVYAVVLNNLSYLDLGIVFAVNGSLVVLLQFRMLRLMTSRWTAIIWRGIGTIVWAVSFLILGISAAFLVILVFMIVSTVGENFTTPTTNTIVTKAAPESLRGTYIGAYSFFSSIGSFMGSVLGLLMLTLFQGITSLFWLIIGLGTGLVSLLYFAMNASYSSEVRSYTEGHGTGLSHNSE